MKAGLSFLWIICFSLLLDCCKPQEQHLSHEQMEAILLDAHLAETYSTMAGKDSGRDLVTKNQDSLAAWYHAIFAHHHVTAAQFNESMDWYRGHPDELDTLYSHIIRKFDKQDAKPYIP